MSMGLPHVYGVRTKVELAKNIHTCIHTYIRVGHDLAECEARRASASLFPGLEDTRRPARVSTFWAESAPSLQKSPKKNQFRFFRA